MSRTAKLTLMTFAPALLACLPACTGYNGHDTLSDDTSPRSSVAGTIGPEMIGPSSESSGGIPTESSLAPSDTPVRAGAGGAAAGSPGNSETRKGDRSADTKGDSPSP